MEPIVGAIAEGEWSSLSGMYTIEEADFMAQLLGNFPVSTEFHGSSILGNSSSSSSTFCPSHGANNEGSYYSLDSGSSIFFPSLTSQESFYLSDSHPILGSNDSNNSTNNNNKSFISLDLCLIGDQGDECLNPEPGFPVNTLQPKKESEIKAAEPAAAEESSKKRSRNAADVQKNNKRNVKSKKNKKNAAVSASSNAEDNESNAGANRLLQPSSSCYSKDESNASQDQNGGEDSSMSSKGNAALNLSGKTRASRGSATDPQSLYARKRRERINERLRILQNLIPNGTKVDISTMLEEAVQYVTFLRLQIKLLSSDDLWMYAPIAYNGMNIGPDHLKLAAASKLSWKSITN